MDSPNRKHDVNDTEARTPSRLVERHRAQYDDPGREARWAKWREDNAAAIASSNAWYEKNGHPLAAYMIKPGDLLSR